VNPRKLALFRQYKDPLILAAQFEPVFKRVLFLISVDTSDLDRFCSSTKDLVDFVKHLQMGSYYGQKIAGLLEYSFGPSIFSTADRDDENEQREVRNRTEFFETTAANRAQVLDLVMELLRYQSWEPRNLNS
jgi:hypothetical protein